MRWILIEQGNSKEEIIFEDVVNSIDLPEWFIDLLYKIWDLYKGKFLWTLANLKDLIKKEVDLEEDNVRNYIEGVISKNNEEE